MTTTKSIWDLAKGDNFRLLEGGVLCIVITPTEDGKGLVAEYLDGEAKGQQDFVFEHEIDKVTL
jgi:hypothetical protein